MWGPDAPLVPPQTAARWFSVALLGFVGLGVIVNYAHPQIPAVRREYPFSGLVSELGSLEANTVCCTRVVDEAPETDSFTGKSGAGYGGRRVDLNVRPT